MKTLRAFLRYSLLLLLLACARDPGFTYLPSSEVHQQNQMMVANQLDILWVIDNSLSMDVSQDRLAKNFDSFIDGFGTRSLDYQMAVTTTEAWVDDFSTAEECYSCLRDGNPTDGPSGFTLVSPRIPDMKSVFLKNMLQGVEGRGDERAFQSIRSTLNNPLNKGLLREGSYFAVIIVSDEDDFSHSSSEYLEKNYDDSRLESLDITFEYLDLLTRRGSPIPMFNLSTITIPNEECLAEIVAVEGGSGQSIGHRYIELAQRTGGLVGSLCDEFSKTLQQISGKLLDLLTRFQLRRRPDPDTIRITVNGVSIPRDDKNGWTYTSEDNSIRFNGESVPEEGAEIQIDFTPIEIKS